MIKSLDSDQDRRFVGPDLDSNFVQRLSVDNKRGHLDDALVSELTRTGFHKAFLHLNIFSSTSRTLMSRKSNAVPAPYFRSNPTRCTAGCPAGPSGPVTNRYI